MWATVAKGDHRNLPRQGGNVQGTIGGLTNCYSHCCATYEEYHDQRYEAGSTLYGPHTLDDYIQEFSRTSVPHFRPSPTPESAEATASPTPSPTWCKLLLHHQSKLHGELCSRGRFRHQTSFLVTLHVRDFRAGCCGTRWLYTARITVDRLVLWVLRQTMRSLVSNEARRERAGLCTPTARLQPRLIKYETLNVPAIFVVIHAVLSLCVSDC